jgi:hypothetical protein
MPRIFPAILGSLLTALRATASRRTDVLYIGLGNRFDDDRRLVRVAAPQLLASVHRQVPFRPDRSGT